MNVNQQTFRACKGRRKGQERRIASDGKDYEKCVLKYGVT